MLVAFKLINATPVNEDEKNLNSNSHYKYFLFFA